jgi:hypothetical protein
MLLRNEKKYLVPNHLLNALRKRMGDFLRPDIFSRENESGLPEYTVRSIYYDNRELHCYHEKVEGIMFRRKFRVRGYHFPEKDSLVVMEIKRKMENRVKKHRAFLKYDDLDQLLSSGNIEKYVIPMEGDDDPYGDASRFLYHYNKSQFLPTCLITYDREAYHGLMDPGVRITYDKNIRSLLFPKTADLYSENGLRVLFPGHFILEVKYFTDEMPAWIRSVLHEFRLRNEALSKYALGIDVHKSLRVGR